MERAMISQDMYDDLKAAYDATRNLLHITVSKGEQLQQVRNEQESTIRELKNELQVSAKSIDFWSDLAANNAASARDYRKDYERAQETIRQLRIELAETKQAMLLGVLAE